MRGLFATLQERLAAAPLDDATASAFMASLAEVNRRRLRIFVPLMIVVHAAHAIAFRLGAAERATLDATVAMWRDGVFTVHLATIAADVLVGALTLRADARATRFAGPAFALVYLLHGAIVVGVDQLVLSGVTPFIGYGLGIATVLALPPRQSVAVYGVGLAVFVAMMSTLQDDPVVRMGAMPPGFSMSIVSVALAWILHAGRRRDFAQRATIDRQQKELESLNADLEQRVAARVAEVEKLNAALQARVQERSAELSQALSKLALRNQPDGVLVAGTRLGDRFVVDHMLGEGGMGAVYAGVDDVTGDPVAIKVVQASSAHQLDTLHRFLREAKTAATIRHDGVVRTLHVDVTSEGLLYQVQELVVGITLARMLRNRKPASPAFCARLGSVLCDALHAAHAEGVVHRDVKPDNIMITRAQPGLKLLDFGVAKLYDHAEHQTAVGLIVGTPTYMAPEQVDASADITDRVDVYAVGLILYWILAGTLPFEAATPTARMVLRTQRDAPDVRTIAPQAGEALAACIAAALARAPSERPSALEMAHTLSEIADSLGAPPLSTFAPDDAASVPAEEPDVSGARTATKAMSPRRAGLPGL